MCVRIGTSDNKKVKTIAYLSARGGSKSIPYKNIKDFNGKPLLLWCIDEALKSEFLNEVWICTDDIEVHKVATARDVRTILVPPIDDFALQEKTLVPFARREDFGHVILLQATTPFTTSNDIDGAFERYFSGEYDSLVSVVRQHRFVWELSGSEAFPVNYNLNNRVRRQDWDGLLIENGAFFITSRKALLNSKCRLSGRIGIYEMSAESYFEIDNLTDWFIAEQLIKRRESNAKQELLHTA